MSDTVSRQEFDELCKKVDSLSSSGGKKVKRTRAPTLYNRYVGIKSKEFRSKDDKLSQKEAFGKAVEAWNKLSDKEKEKFEKSLSKDDE